MADGPTLRPKSTVQQDCPAPEMKWKKNGKNDLLHNMLSHTCTSDRQTDSNISSTLQSYSLLNLMCLAAKFTGKEPKISHRPQVQTRVRGGWIQAWTDWAAATNQRYGLELQGNLSLKSLTLAPLLYENRQRLSKAPWLRPQTTVKGRPHMRVNAP